MSDNLAACFPVSVKGVIKIGNDFVLLKNERDEWELPGGKLEMGEGLENCLLREIKEELALSTTVMRPLNNWVYFVNGVHVVIVTYLLRCSDPNARPQVSAEHKELGLFPLEQISLLLMPDGYKTSISLASESPVVSMEEKKQRILSYITSERIRRGISTVDRLVKSELSGFMQGTDGDIQSLVERQLMTTEEGYGSWRELNDPAIVDAVYRHLFLRDGQ
jgi:8-oxo-dGTP pyrophosphatase MutT (NUDIX family)